MTTQGPTPPGLSSIYSMLKTVYPDQPNPVQVSALVKYWLNGPDPLDYISMFYNSGNPHLGIAPHWHYVSCGLSDLHGDGRVHGRAEGSNDDGPSGFGMELTFRLKKYNESNPPTWPAQLMQSLAKYIFSSDARLCNGDHISWHTALDGKNDFMQQMLIADDPQLPSLNTPFGYVKFCQIVGVCTEEQQAAQQWDGLGVLNLLKQIPEVGGSWLVTDIERPYSIFQVDPKLREHVEIGISQDGSNLSGVGSKCWWLECSQDTIASAVNQAYNFHGDHNRPSSSTLSMRIRSSLANHRSVSSDQPDYRDTSRLSNYSSVSELLTARPIKDGLQLRFNLEAATLLPLAIKGRLAHGRHFTFQSVAAESAITFVSRDITGTSVDERTPYAALKRWLQILVPDDFLEQLAHDFDELQRPEEVVLPRVYVWPERRLMITIVDDSV